MMSVPCVSTTLPSNVAVFCASSALMVFDSMLIGLSRSPRSARAGGATSADAAASTSPATQRLLPRPRIERAFDLRLQRELLPRLVENQADPRQRRSPVGNRHRLVGAQDALPGEDVEELRARAKLGLLRSRLAHDQHVAVQESFLPLPAYRPAICRRDEIAALRDDLHHARVEHLAGAVVGEVLHLRGRKRVLEFPNASRLRTA